MESEQKFNRNSMTKACQNLDSIQLSYIIWFTLISTIVLPHTNVNKYIPTHLGKGELHIRRPPPRQISSGAPSKR